MDLGKLGENLRDFRLKGGTFWTEVLGRKMVLRNLACGPVPYILVIVAMGVWDMFFA